MVDRKFILMLRELLNEFVEARMYYPEEEKDFKEFINWLNELEF